MPFFILIKTLDRIECIMPLRSRHHGVLSHTPRHPVLYTTASCPIHRGASSLKPRGIVPKAARQAPPKHGEMQSKPRCRLRRGTMHEESSMAIAAKKSVKSEIYFLHAFMTSPIYMVWMPAGKFLYIFLGTSSLNPLGSNGATYIILHSITIVASV